jgi:GGDEF domain-containing protein
VKSQFEATAVQEDDVEADGTSKKRLLLRAFGQLEAVVAGSLAALTGWQAAATFSDLPILWVFVLFAVAVALWAWFRRPATQSEMAMRSTVLLTGAYALQLCTSVSPDAVSLFHLWLGVTALAYALVLKPGWGALLAVSAVVVFTLASLSGGDESVASLASGGAFLWIVPVLLAMGVGALVRRPGAQARASMDSSTSLYNQGGLLAHGQELLESLQRERRELTLAVFDCSDLLEVRQIYGNRTSRKLIACIIRKLSLLAGERGLAARTGPAQFAVAMPMSREKALLAIGRALGNPTRIELEGGNSEIVLVPNLMVETVADGSSVERLFRALSRGLARLQEEEQLRQRYLQRERERHSRPMALRPPIDAPEAPVPARASPLASQPAVLQQIPTTIPMPLPAR